MVVMDILALLSASPHTSASPVVSTGLLVSDKNSRRSIGFLSHHTFIALDLGGFSIVINSHYTYMLEYIVNGTAHTNQIRPQGSLQHMY